MAITKAEIKEDVENKLLKRRELRVALEFEGGTPSRDEIKRSIADKFNLKEANMVIVKAEQLYGTKEGLAVIHEYHDAESMKIAQKHVLQRPKTKGGKEAAPQPAAAAAPSERKETEKKEAPKKE